MALGMARPKSKLPSPSTNFKFSNKQDYMSEAMHGNQDKVKDAMGLGKKKK